jgi:hypothetical protein
MTPKQRLRIGYRRGRAAKKNLEQHQNTGDEVVREQLIKLALDNIGACLVEIERVGKELK